MTKNQVFPDHPYTVPADLDQFWVITVLSNPVRYKRRYELYYPFKNMCQQAGVKLVTVELATGDRPHMVTIPEDPYALQLRSPEELWHKENMISLGIAHARNLANTMGQKVREVAWVDADCRPAMPYRCWFEETWHQLQIHEFIQMWEYYVDLDSHHNVIGKPNPGFISKYIEHGYPDAIEYEKIQKKNVITYGKRLFGAPGLAWAANISALDKVGGIITTGILGAGDWYMAMSLVGMLEIAIKEFLGTEYAKPLIEWQRLATRHIKRDVGFVKGTVYHDFHGKKVNRGYTTRGEILKKNKFNPITDLKRDTQGLYQLESWTPRQQLMRDQIRSYFRSRNEDEIFP